MRSIAIDIGSIIASIIAWEIGKAMVRGVRAMVSVAIFLLVLWRALTPLWRERMEKIDG
jgi:hypothetical protein